MTINLSSRKDWAETALKEMTCEKGPSHQKTSQWNSHAEGMEDILSLFEQNSIIPENLAELVESSSFFKTREAHEIHTEHLASFPAAGRVDFIFNVLYCEIINRLELEDPDKVFLKNCYYSNLHQDNRFDKFLELCAKLNLPRKQGVATVFHEAGYQPSQGPSGDSKPVEGSRNPAEPSSIGQRLSRSFSAAKQWFQSLTEGS